MDMSPPNATVDPLSHPSRTKSGRVTKKPEALSPSSSTKRKRNEPEEALEDSDAESETGRTEDQDANDDPDEEELRDRRRKKRASAGKPKPAAKKSKPNAVAALPIRGAKAKSGKTSKPRSSQGGRVSAAQNLFDSVFAAEEDSLEDIAAKWLQRFAVHESNALSEIVNFALRCAGCELEVDSNDIEDPDNCPARLTDIMDEFQQQRISDYPLIAKGRAAARFRRNMTGFINVLVQSISAKGLLFDEPALIENIQIWINTMSSAANRPFRHTSTVIALEVVSAFCILGRDFVDSRAKILQQAEGEQKNKKVNQSRVREMRAQAEEAAGRKTQLDGIIKDWFDVVFVHRYRDIDPRIRVDSVTYLSDWISTYSEQFLDGQHLRYLGWVLSDTSAPTRVEVAKQLQRIYKDDSKTAGLRQFTERFRPRMVEMATRDGEVNVRRTSIELLNVLREKGLLEPDDIDAIGQLIFDVDPKVRKAVVPFFVASVDDSYDAKVDEYDSDMLQDFESATADGIEGTRLEWVKFKALAELLNAYGTADLNDSSKTEPDVVDGFLPVTDSRTAIAARAVLQGLPILSKWEQLAAFLATDHSEISNEAQDEIDAQIRRDCKLSEREEIILLDVLNVSVQQTLSEVIDRGPSKKAKKTKVQIQILKDKQESAAQQLAAWIPRLLKKFGSISEATSTVLRLEHVLNLDVFQQLRQDNATYAALLEDINRQFLSHESSSVIGEAKAALLHAQSFEELQEITVGKVQALWDDTTLMLARLCRGEDMATRGNLHVSALSAMSSTALRLANLSSIADCTVALQTPVQVTSNNPRRKSANSPPVVPIDCLVDIVGRGVPTTYTDDETEAAENSLISNTFRCLLFYFMWRTTDLRTARPSSMQATLLIKLFSYCDTVSAHLVAIITARHGADPLRFQAAGMLLELATLFNTLNRHPAAVSAINEADLDLANVSRLDSAKQRLVMKVFAAAERNFAQSAGKMLPASTAETQAGAATQQALNGISDSESDDPAQDPTTADPVSSDDENEDGDDDNEMPEALKEDESTRRRRGARQQRKQRTMLLAEQALCALTGKIVLALVGKTIPDRVEVTARLKRNVMKLGTNFRDVMKVLDAEANGSTKRVNGVIGGKSLTNGVATAQKNNARKPARARSDESSEHEDDDLPAEEDGEEDLRNRELLLDEPSDRDEESDHAANGRDDEIESVLGD